MSDILNAIANVAILTYVLSSMVALGLSFTVEQILRPLKNVKLVILGLAANFVVAPAAAWAVGNLLGLSDALALGLLLLGTAAGAPFLPKLAQIVKGDVAYSVGLMVLLMVVTIVYVPLLIVPLAQGVDVSAWEIAQPLVIYMLIPLAIALLVRARYEESAALAPHLNQIATVTLAIGVVLAIGLGLPELIDAFGTRAFIAAILFTVSCVAAGYFLGGSGRGQRWVTALGTGQRNISAALLLATTSFANQGEVLVMVMVGAVLGLLILMPLAAEVGKRTPDPFEEVTL